MTTKIIHIVIIGEYHCDPAPSWITRQILSHSLARKQTVIYADEDTPDSTLNSKIEGNKQFILMNAAAIKTNSLQVLFSKKLPRPCFQHTSLTSIAKLLSKKFSENEVKGCIDGLKLHASIPERLKLYQFLQEKEIPCHSIDVDKDTRELTLKSDAQALALDGLRTRHMVSNIVSICNSKFPNGGLLLARIGTYHVPRLFLALKQELGHQETTNYEFIVEGIKLESPYFDEILPKNRPPESKNMMMGKFFSETANGPISEEPCVENPDGSFTAPILSRLGASFYTSYQLPADNAVTRQQVQDVSGQIIKQLPNGGLLVNIHSAYLLASVRKNLGIERYRLKFSAEGSERMAYLEAHCPDMTIERESENNCLVTFPKSPEVSKHLEIIKNDEKWRQHCDEVLAAKSSTQLTMN